MSASFADKISQLVQPIVKRIPDTARGISLHKEIETILENSDIQLRIELKKLFDSCLINMLKNEASDIDLGGPGCAGKIWYRVYGNKYPLKNSSKISFIETDILLHNLLLPTQRESLLKNKNVDFSYSVHVGDEKNQRFRADIYFDLDHLALNMRRINETIRPFKTLNLHPEVAKALSLKYYKYGLTLVTGISGAGKSSTLDSIIDLNNRTVDSHIVIIASPVEFIHDPIRCVVRHREVGSDVHSFKDGAIQALRQDPDIIVIGELRDLETIMTSLEVADSGHKTFGTLHTSSAIESIERIVAESKTDEQDRIRFRLADVLTCVISQKLVPTLDGNIVLAKEILLANSSTKAAIRNNNLTELYQMMMEGRDKGMHTMEQDLKHLYDKRKISKETALNYSNNKTKMLQLFSGLDF